VSGTWHWPQSDHYYPAFEKKKKGPRDGPVSRF
jgi:hypothetical protein